MKKVIFIGGIHGVGKSSFCKILSEQTGLLSYSSGELIKSAKADISVNKRTDDVNNNQNILVDIVSNIESADLNIILDGHFCLINKSDHIERIPLRTFCDLNLQGIIILFEEPKVISDRLLKRDGIKYSFSLLEELQNEELKYAREVGDLLGIEVLCLRSGYGEQEAIEYIRKVGRKNNDR